MLEKIDYLRQFILNLTKRIEVFSLLFRLKNQADRICLDGRTPEDLPENSKEYIVKPVVLIPPQSVNH